MRGSGMVTVSELRLPSISPRWTELAQVLLYFAADDVFEPYVFRAL